MMSRTAISTPRSLSRASETSPSDSRCQPVAPAVVVAEVIAAGQFARLLDEQVRVESLGCSRCPPRRDGRVVRTAGASGLSSQRSTTKPRCRPPVSSQWPCPKSLAPMAIRTMPSASGRNALVGDGAVPVPRLEAFVPDALQRDVPVPRVGRAELEHQRLVGLQREGADHVQVVGCGVGAARVRPPPRSAACWAGSAARA